VTIYGVSTVAEIEQTLADHLAATYRPEQAYDWAMQTAKIEGALEVVRATEATERNARAKDWDDQRVTLAVLDTLVTKLAEGPDDNWSGRGNDLRRSRFDGKIEAARNVQAELHARLATAARS